MSTIGGKVRDDQTDLLRSEASRQPDADRLDHARLLIKPGFDLKNDRSKVLKSNFRCYCMVKGQIIRYVLKNFRGLSYTSLSMHDIVALARHIPEPEISEEEVLEVDLKTGV